VNSLNPTPLASPSRSTVQSRGRTYSVKILGGRQVLATTEFPNANPPVDTPSRRHEHDDDSDSISSKRTKRAAVTPRDRSRIHGLRQDPSVASLLDMYDDHGNLDSKIFSSSPVKQGRTQIQRNGSTLRQLLGSSELHDAAFRNSTTEGDISWAERFLQYVWFHFEQACRLTSTFAGREKARMTLLRPRTLIRPLSTRPRIHTSRANQLSIYLTLETLRFQPNTTPLWTAFPQLTHSRSRLVRLLKTSLTVPRRTSAPRTTANQLPRLDPPLRFLASFWIGASRTGSH
jgi:hypothetical protein